MAQLVSQIDQLLTQAIAAYVPKNFIDDLVFPKVNVMSSTGKLGKLGTSHLRLENSLKAGRGKYRRVIFSGDVGNWSHQSCRWRANRCVHQYVCTGS